MKAFKGKIRQDKSISKHYSCPIVKNKVLKDITTMDTSEKVKKVNEILASEAKPKVSKLKRDKGLIERTESSKMVITEDNKELMLD